MVDSCYTFIVVRDVDMPLVRGVAARLAEAGVVTPAHISFLRNGRRWVGPEAVRRYGGRKGLTVYEAWWDLMGFHPVDVPPAMVLAAVGRPALTRYVYYRWSYPRAQVIPEYATMRRATDRLMGDSAPIEALMRLAHQQALSVAAHGDVRGVREAALG